VLSIHTAVIGGGAAGIVAAISSKRRGFPTVICEKMPVMGKKILASGNGRCNLLNEDLRALFYNNSAQTLTRSVFARYGKEKILAFFKELGLETYSEEGRVFPVTNQSSTVLKVLEMELNRLAVPIEYNFSVTGISYEKGRFLVRQKQGKAIQCKKVIIAGGGKSYPALGSDGSCYELARKLGHEIIEPVPAAVPLDVKDRLCHLLQGQKIPAKVRAIANGNTISEAMGDLLFTKYGLSGTAVIDSSEAISIAVNRGNNKNVCISVDMAPFIETGALEKRIMERMKKGIGVEDLMVGILPNKFGRALKEEIDSAHPEEMARLLKNRMFKVLGTRGWNEAEFTSGGVDLKQVNETTLESRLVKGLYFAGEVLDVCGSRGGYNLAWAWASGFVAGGL
jgi:hypothetical protein